MTPLLELNFSIIYILIVALLVFIGIIGATLANRIDNLQREIKTIKRKMQK